MPPLGAGASAWRGSAMRVYVEEAIRPLLALSLIDDETGAE
jgi:hypothetical protein